MSAIGPGDRVRCIKEFSPDGRPSQIKLGAIYTVARIRDDFPGICGSCGGTDPGVDMMEIRPDPHGSWCLCSFAPTWEGDEESREALAKHEDRRRRLIRIARELTKAGR